MTKSCTGSVGNPGQVQTLRCGPGRAHHDFRFCCTRGHLEPAPSSPAFQGRTLSAPPAASDIPSQPPGQTLIPESASSLPPKEPQTSHRSTCHQLMHQRQEEQRGPEKPLIIIMLVPQELAARSNSPSFYKTRFTHTHTQTHTPTALIRSGC